MAPRDYLELLQHTYSGIAYLLFLFCGLLTVMGERFLYARRQYKREATITAAIGWTYIVGGTLLYLFLAMLNRSP